MSATSSDSVMQQARERLRRRESAREKERVLRDIDKTWRGLIDSTKGIPEAMMAAPGVFGQWSVKDILAHIAAWDRMTTRVVMQIMRGDEPEWPIHEQKFNDLQHEADLNLSVTETRNRALSAHKALVEMLDGRGEVRDAWLRATTIAHYPEHTEQILQWRHAQGIPAQPMVRSGDGGFQQDIPSTSSAHANVPTPEAERNPRNP